MDPLDAIHLPPKLNDADRAEIVREMQLAGDAIWPRVLMEQAGVVDAIRKAR